MVEDKEKSPLTEAFRRAAIIGTGVALGQVLSVPLGIFGGLSLAFGLTFGATVASFAFVHEYEKKVLGLEKQLKAQTPPAQTPAPSH